MSLVKALKRGSLREPWGFAIREGAAVVIAVAPGSPAAVANLRVGDELLAVDRSPLPGKPAFVKPFMRLRQGRLRGEVKSGGEVDVRRGSKLIFIFGDGEVKVKPIMLVSFRFYAVHLRLAKCLRAEVVLVRRPPPQAPLPASTHSFRSLQGTPKRRRAPPSPPSPPPGLEAEMEWDEE